MNHQEQVLEAAALALQPGEREPFVIDGAQLTLVERALQASYNDPSLPKVVEELCLFACWIGSAKGSPAARDVLLRLAETSFDALKALGDKTEAMLLEVQAARASRDFSRLTGRAKERFEPRAPNASGVTAGPLARFTLQKDKKK